MSVVQDESISKAIALNNSGVSLVELLVAMASLSIVMAIVYQLFWGQTRITNAEHQILLLQRNARVADQRLGFLIQHAGFGCSESFPKQTISGQGPDGEAITVNNLVSNIFDSQPGQGSDSVIFALGFKKVAEVDEDHKQTNIIDFKNVKTPTINNSSADFKNYVTFFPNIEGDVFYKVIDIDNDYVLEKEIEKLRDDTQVFMVSLVKVKKEKNKLYLQNMTYNSCIYWTVAEYLQEVQIQYLDKNLSWVNKADDPLAVRFFLLFKSEYNDPGYVNNQKYRLANATIGPFNDSYHRLLLEREVWIQNARH